MPVIVMEECDKKGCPAEALFRVATWGGSLFFCGHHTRETAPDLIAQGFAVARVSGTG